MIHKEELLKRSLDGTYYLDMQKDRNGKIVNLRKYGVMIDVDKYNLLSHCSCIWTMKDILEFQNFSITNSIKRASEYIQDNFIREPNRYFLLDDNFIKLGGQALAMLALGKRYPQDVELLKNGLLSFITVEKGSIVLNDMWDSKNSKFVNINSKFYPGEASLALAKFFDYEKSFLIVAYLKSKNILTHDYWLLQSMAELVQIGNEEFNGIIVPYADLIAKKIMREKYKYWGKPTEKACRAEGLISYYRIVAYLINNYAKLDETKIFINELIEEQIKYQDKNGGFHDENGLSKIDDTQHNISSFLKYIKYIK